MIVSRPCYHGQSGIFDKMIGGDLKCLHVLCFLSPVRKGPYINLHLRRSAKQYSGRMIPSGSSSSILPVYQFTRRILLIRDDLIGRPGLVLS